MIQNQLLEPYYDRTESGIVLLTPDEQRCFDPTGEATKSVAGMKGVIKHSPNPVNPIWSQRGSEQWLKWLQPMIQAEEMEKYPLTREYDLEMMSKFAPQGGGVPWEFVMRSLRASYELAFVPVNFSPSLMEALRYLLRVIKFRMEAYGPPQFAGVYDGFSRENSGLPWFTRKDSWRALGEAQKRVSSGIFYPLPDVPGTRYYRLKDRVFHKDAFSNVYELGPYLKAIRTWLRNYIPELFGSWDNPEKTVEVQATYVVDFSYDCAGFDFSAADEHYSLECFQKLVAPVLSQLTPDPMLASTMISFIERLFCQPIFLGDTMLTGQHNVLSGSPIANDVETIADATLAIATVIDDDQHPKEAKYFLLGDDVNIALRRWNSDPLVLFQKNSAAVGQVVEIKKCFRSNAGMRYLRRTYERGLPRHFNTMASDNIARHTMRGAYPLTLALNSLVNPEYWNADVTQNVLASLQRTDNCWGHPRFAQFAVEFWAHFARTETLELETQFEFTDWFEKLYGERWDPKTSPTVAVLKNARRLPATFVL